MDNYFEHQELVKRFKLLALKELPNLRIFDRHVGLFYAKHFEKGIINYVPVKINTKGMADTYMLYRTEKGIIHIEGEFKTGKAVQTKEQKDWEIFINSMNGIYVIIRDETRGVLEIKQILHDKGLL